MGQTDAGSRKSLRCVISIDAPIKTRSGSRQRGLKIAELIVVMLQIRTALSHNTTPNQVCCSALWVVVSSGGVKASPPPPRCDSLLEFSSEVSSASEGNGNIHRRSLSPWTWKSNTEMNRIPSTLWEANCSSSFCSTTGTGQTDGHNLNSVPVYQNILVLWRNEGRCYTAAYRSLAVGCTCIWATTNHD
ncbi:LOW QUALITY PROTEIN: interleukin 17a/f2 [Sander vitreus]